MSNPAERDPNPDDSDDEPAERRTTVIALLGSVAIAVGVGGIVLTDASLTDVGSVSPLLLVFGLGCYVYLKQTGSV